MTGAELQAWQDRMGFNQIAGARVLVVPVQTYRNWLHDRRAIPDPVELLCAYIEEYGFLETRQVSTLAAADSPP